MALKIFFPCGARVVIFVPSQEGLREFSTYTNAVDVGPDFNALGTQGRAEDCGGIVGAAAANRGCYPGAVRSDEAAHDWNFPGIKQRLHFGQESLVGFILLRHRFHIATVGHENVARVDVHALQSVGGKCSSHDFAGEHLAERGHMIGGSRGQLADRGNAAQQLIETLEVAAEFRMKIRKQCRAQQFAGRVVVPLLKRAAEFERGLALSGSGGARHGKQRVGDFGHGADHKVWLRFHSTKS